MPSPLRNLPAVHAVIRHPEVQRLVADGTMSQTEATDCARRILNELRCAAESCSAADFSLQAVAQRTVAAATQRMQRRLHRVINATGIILHTNLGRAPLCSRATDRLIQAARSTNVELDLSSGRRSQRGRYAEELLCEITGAEAALVVNNCAAATMLALQGAGAGKEVIISRGQLVEIGGGFRLPEVFSAAGVTLREVGTSNRTRIDDYEQAITPETAGLLRVHRSNFRVSGFVREPSVAELSEIAHRHGLPMIDDLGSGCLAGLQSMRLDEPDVETSLNSGADLVLFSGDKLLGGPQAGILLGSADWIGRLRVHPMARAVRVCKLTLAALEATLEEHLAGHAFETVPVLTMMAASSENIRDRCEHVLREVSSTAVSVVATQAEVGGGSLADQKIKSFALRLTTDHPDNIVASLRTGPQPVLARIMDGAVVFDLRTVHPDDDRLILSALQQIDTQRSADR